MKWIDLPNRKSCFTARNTAMIDLDKNKVVQYYSANTKIAVVQKCVTAKGTFYRTESAKEKGLNWAFKATVLGLPDEKAPSVPIKISLNNSSAPTPRTHQSARKQKSVKKVALPKGGEAKHQRNWISKLFRRNHGKAKNS